MWCVVNHDAALLNGMHIYFFRKFHPCADKSRIFANTNRVADTEVVSLRQCDIQSVAVIGQKQVNSGPGKFRTWWFWYQLVNSGLYGFKYIICDFQFSNSEIYDLWSRNLLQCMIELKLRSEIETSAQHIFLSPRNSVGGDKVTRPFVSGWVSGCVSACVRPSRCTLWAR